ncbi:hypothetical protein AAHA92_30626 [Salvia divinorum]|uniref:Uncharacterized protein n=1 Tax=Salvia divinorum TaxID=28513 RepID=A0ABD1FRH1_SALDI
MGYKQSPTLIVAALLLLATATPLAYGQQTNNGILSARICCTSTGNCPPGSVGIPGVRASLNCTTLFGNVVTLAQGVTGANGVLNLGLNNILGVLGSLLSGILPCGVFVNLPLNSTICPILSTVDGVLVGIPKLVNTIVDPVLGLVRNITVPVFINTTIGR